MPVVEAIRPPGTAPGTSAASAATRPTGSLLAFNGLAIAPAIRPADHPPEDSHPVSPFDCVPPLWTAKPLQHIGSAPQLPGEGDPALRLASLRRRRPPHSPPHWSSGAASPNPKCCYCSTARSAQRCSAVSTRIHAGAWGVPLRQVQFVSGPFEHQAGWPWEASLRAPARARMGAPDVLSRGRLKPRRRCRRGDRSPEGDVVGGREQAGRAIEIGVGQRAARGLVEGVSGSREALLRRAGRRPRRRGPTSRVRRLWRDIGQRMARSRAASDLPGRAAPRRSASG
jgi:hypothetical protein